MGGLTLVRSRAPGGENFSVLFLDQEVRRCYQFPAMNGTPVASTAPASLEFKDRRTGLIVFGILEILLGGLAALMIPLMVFGQVLAAKANQEPPLLRQII